jgi:hypothetical protein
MSEWDQFPKANDWNSFPLASTPMPPAKAFGAGLGYELKRGAAGIARPFERYLPESLRPASPEELNAAEQELAMRGGGYGTAGRIAGEIAKSAPVMMIPGVGLPSAIGRVATSAGLAALLEPEKRGQAALYGAGGALGGEAVPYIGGTIKRAIEPLYEGGQQNIIARALRRSVGGRSEDIAQELTAAKSMTPGVEYTASEAAPSSGGLAAMQRWAEQAAPEDYAFRRKQNVEARRAALEGIAGSEPERLAALAERESVTKPLYEQAMSEMVPVDESLRILLKRPSMQSAFNQAKAISAEQGKPIPADLQKAILSGEIPAEISGEALHWIKLGLDELRSLPTESIGKVQQRAIKDTVNAFEDWRGQNIPIYGQAQSEFARLSKPITRMDVGQALYEKVAPALSDYGVLTRETPERFAAALRAGDVTAQKATGFGGARLADIMTPDDLRMYSSVANDLTRQAQSGTAGRGIGSNTFQNLAMQNLAERAGFPGKMLGKATRLPLIDYAYTRAEQEMQKQLAETLLNPEVTAQLLRRNAGPLEQLFSRNMPRGFSAVGSAAGSFQNR